MKNQKLFNYLHDLGVIALESELQEIEKIVLSMQQERMYSEEEVLDILFSMSVDNPNNITKWFEQFKK